MKVVRVMEHLVLLKIGDQIKNEFHVRNPVYIRWCIIIVLRKHYDN